MPTGRPPRLDLSSNSAGSSFKRNFEQFGLDLDSPSGSGSDNERNKRARSETADRRPTPGPSTLHASSSVTLEDAPEDEGSMVVERAASFSPRPFFHSFRPSPPAPDNEGPTADSITSAASVDTTSGGLFPLIVESDAEELPRAPPPVVPPPRLTSSRPLSPNGVRASVERFEAFDSNISALRESVNPVDSAAVFRFRSPTPAPELPPIAQLTSSNPFEPITLPGLSSVRDILPPRAPTTHELPEASVVNPDPATSDVGPSRRPYRERLEDATQHINAAIQLLLSPAQRPRRDSPAPGPAPARRASFPILEEDDAPNLLDNPYPRGTERNRGSSVNTAQSRYAYGQGDEVADRAYGHSLAAYLSALTGSRDRNRQTNIRTHGSRAPHTTLADHLMSVARDTQPDGDSPPLFPYGISRRPSPGTDATQPPSAPNRLQRHNPSSSRERERWAGDGIISGGRTSAREPAHNHWVNPWEDSDEDASMAPRPTSGSALPSPWRDEPRTGTSSLTVENRNARILEPPTLPRHSVSGWRHQLDNLQLASFDYTQGDQSFRTDVISPPPSVSAARTASERDNSMLDARENSGRRTLPPLPRSFWQNERVPFDHDLALSSQDRERDGTEDRQRDILSNFFEPGDVAAISTLDELLQRGPETHADHRTYSDNHRNLMDRETLHRVSTDLNAPSDDVRDSSLRREIVTSGGFFSSSRIRSRPGSHLSLMNESDFARRARQGRASLAEFSNSAGSSSRDVSRRAMLQSLQHHLTPAGTSRTRSRSTSPVPVLPLENQRDRWILDGSDTSGEEMDVDVNAGRSGTHGSMNQNRLADAPLPNVLRASEPGSLAHDSQGGRRSPAQGSLGSLSGWASALSEPLVQAPYRSFADELRELSSSHGFLALRAPSALNQLPRPPERSLSVRPRLPSGPRPPLQNVSSQPVLPPLSSGWHGEQVHPWETTSPVDSHGPSGPSNHNVDRGSRALVPHSPPRPRRDVHSHFRADNGPSDTTPSHDGPVINPAAYNEGPIRATLERFMGGQTRNRVDSLSSGASNSTRTTPRPPPLPPLRLQPDSTRRPSRLANPLSAIPSSAETRTNVASRHRDRLNSLDSASRRLASAAAASQPLRPGSSATTSQRDRREMESALRRRLRLEESEIADGSSNDAGNGRAQGFARTLDLLRADGLSGQRERQLVARFHREQEEEGRRPHPAGLWGALDERDGDPTHAPPPAPPAPPRASSSLRWRRYPFGISSEEAAATSRAERRATSSMGHTRDTMLDGLEAARQERNARLRAQRMQMQQLQRDVLPGVAGMPLESYVNWLRRGRGLGDYVRDDEFDASYEGLISLAERLGDARPRATPSNVIAGLPTARYHEWANDGSDTRCPICLDDYEADDHVLKLPDCAHWLHKQCMEQWLGSANSCPVCRRRVGRPRRVRRGPGDGGPSGLRRARDNDDDPSGGDGNGDRDEGSLQPSSGSGNSGVSLGFSLPRFG